MISLSKRMYTLCATIGILLLLFTPVQSISQYFCRRCLDIQVTPEPGATITSTTTFTFEFSEGVVLTFGDEATNINGPLTDNQIRDRFINRPYSYNGELHYPACIYLEYNSVVYKSNLVTRFGSDRKFALRFASLPENAAFRLFMSCRCLFTPDEFETDSTNFMYYTSGGIIPNISRVHPNFCDRPDYVRTDLSLPPISLPNTPQLLIDVSTPTVQIRMTHDLSTSFNLSLDALTDSSFHTHYELEKSIIISGMKYNKTQAVVPLEWLQAASSMVEKISYVTQEKETPSLFPTRRETIQRLYDEYRLNNESITLIVGYEDYKDLTDDNPLKTLNTSDIEQRATESYSSYFTFSNGSQIEVWFSGITDDSPFPLWMMSFTLTDYKVYCVAGSARNSIEEAKAAYHSLRSERYRIFEVYSLQLPTVNHGLNIHFNHGDMKQQFTLNQGNVAASEKIVIRYKDGDVNQEGIEGYAMAFTARQYGAELDVNSISFIPLQYANPVNTYNTIYMDPEYFKSMASCDQPAYAGLEHSMTFYTRNISHSVQKLKGYANRLQQSNSIRLEGSNLVLTYDDVSINELTVEISSSLLNFKEAYIGEVSYILLPNRSAHYEKNAEYVISFMNSGETNATFSLEFTCIAQVLIHGATKHEVSLSAKERVTYSFSLESTVTDEIVLSNVCNSSILVRKLPLWTSTNKTVIHSDIQLDHGYFIPRCEVYFVEPFLQYSKGEFITDPSIMLDTPNPFNFTILSDWILDSSQLKNNASIIVKNGAEEPIQANISVALSCKEFDVLPMYYQSLVLSEGDTSLLSFDILTKPISTEYVFDNRKSMNYSCFLNVTIDIQDDCWSTIGKAYSGAIDIFVDFECPNGYTGTLCTVPICSEDTNNGLACSGHGNCTAPDTCQCSDGYSGRDCEIFSCYGVDSANKSACSGYGNCTAPDTCTCDSEHSGEECQYLICYGVSSNHSSVCSGSGVCSSPNNCTCYDTFSGVECQYHSCYGYEETNSSVCSGNGNCTQPNICECNIGYTGLQCDIPKCFSINATSEDACNSQGSCIGVDHCICNSNYTGLECSIPICFSIAATDSNSCSSHGNCVAPNQCLCFSNYEGERCEIQIVHSCSGILADNITYVCSGRGNCTEPEKCECMDGYTGLDCETPLCFSIPATHFNVCSSHGQCTDKDLCACHEGYSGSNCSLSICYNRTENDPSVCSNQGTCIGPDECECYVGFNGTECQEKVEPSSANCFGFDRSNKSVCSSHGDCIRDDVCICNDGFIGSRCEYIVCFGNNTYRPSSVCSGHGQCVAPDKCVCSPGYHDVRCQNTTCFGVDSSNGSVCSGNGYCSGPNHCSCEPSYSGDSCANPVCYGVSSSNSSVCSGHGNCSQPNECDCSTGYSGLKCDIPICYSIKSSNLTVCSSNGYCVGPDQCRCYNGFIGDVCDTLANISQICHSSFNISVMGTHLSGSTSIQASTLKWIWSDDKYQAMLNVTSVNSGPRTLSYNMTVQCMNQDLISSEELLVNGSVLLSGHSESLLMNVSYIPLNVPGQRMLALNCSITATMALHHMDQCEKFDTGNPPQDIHHSVSLVNIDVCPLILEQNINSTFSEIETDVEDSKDCYSCSRINVGSWITEAGSNYSISGSDVNTTAYNEVSVRITNDQSFQSKFSGYLECKLGDNVVFSMFQVSPLLKSMDLHTFLYNVSVPNVTCFVMNNNAPGERRPMTEDRQRIVKCDLTLFTCKFRVGIEPNICWSGRYSRYARDISFDNIDSTHTFKRLVTKQDILLVIVSAVVLVVGSALILILTRHPRDPKYMIYYCLVIICPSLKDNPKGLIDPLTSQTTEQTIQCSVCQVPARYSVLVPSFSSRDSQFDVCDNERCFNHLNDEFNADELDNVRSVYDYHLNRYLTDREKTILVRQRVPKQEPILLEQSGLSDGDSKMHTPISKLPKSQQIRIHQVEHSPSILEEKEMHQYEDMVSHTNFAANPSPGNVANFVQLDEEDWREHRAYEERHYVPTLIEPLGDDILFKSNISLLKGRPLIKRPPPPRPNAVQVTSKSDNQPSNDNHQ